ncbi:MAG: hypothetical protein RIG62_02725 [Cyclobacteriaceae bacterium]
MTKQSATDTFEAQKEKVQEIVNKLADQLNLDEEEIGKAKEWGIALLVTGVSVFIVYRLLQRLFGVDKDVPVMEAEPESDPDHIERSTALFRTLKEQAALFLVTVAQRQIMQFLQKNNIVDDDE